MSLNLNLNRNTKRAPLRPQYNATLSRLLQMIIEYKSAHDGNSPTVRWLTGQMRFSSTSVTNYHLESLHKLGKIRLPDGDRQSRGIEVVGGRWSCEVAHE